MCAAYYSAALNSLVHMVMYMYYFLASAIGRDEKKRRKYLWWGKYLTMFQMTQFVTMVFQVPPRPCPLAPCMCCLLHACVVCSMHVLFAPCTCCLLHACVVCSMHVLFAPCTCCLLHARVVCSMHVLFAPRCPAFIYHVRLRVCCSVQGCSLADKASPNTL